MSEKKVVRILPIAMKIIGERLARVHCRVMGLTEDLDEYVAEFKKYIFNFNDEAYGMSMTPSGLVGNGLSCQNPATPKVQEAYFDLTTGIFGPTGYIEKLETVCKEMVSSEQKLRYKRQLRGNIVSMVHFILETKYDMIIKSRNGKISDFQIELDSTPEDREKKIMNQYLRYVYVTKTIKALEEVINGEKISTSDVLDSTFGEDWKKETAKFLNPKGRRVEFVNAIYKEKKSLDTKQNPSTKPMSHKIVCKELGCFFDTIKLNKLVNSKKDETIEVVPKESYIKHRELTEAEISRCDMNKPIVVGTHFKNKKNENFLIYGEGQILKARSLGIPVLDCIVLSAEETKNAICN